MVPRETPAAPIDVTAAMYVPTIGHDILDDLFLEEPEQTANRQGVE